jgi:hypothetical protein
MMFGEPFFLYERVNNYGMYGDLTTGLSIGNPRVQSLDAKTARIVASSHNGVTVMFWNDYGPDSLVQWESNVNPGGEPVYGPSGESVTLEAVLNNLLFYWEDAAEIREECQ